MPSQAKPSTAMQSKAKTEASVVFVPVAVILRNISIALIISKCSSSVTKRGSVVLFQASVGGRRRGGGKRGHQEEHDPCSRNELDARPDLV